MDESVQISAAQLREHAEYFGTYRHLVTLEMAGRPLDEAYELFFSRLLKPNPSKLFHAAAAATEPLLLGTDQRDSLARSSAPRLLALRPGAVVLDIGAGDGLTTALALMDREDALTLIPLDPLDAYLDQYANRMRALPGQISVSRCINAGIDEMLQAHSPATAGLDERLDAVLSYHSLYFAQDLHAFLHFTLERLLTGGSLIVAFAEDRGGFVGSTARDFLEEVGLKPDGDERAEGGPLARFFGLGDEPPSTAEVEGHLRQTLARDDFQVVEVERQATRVYGHDPGDLVAAALLGDVEHLGHSRVAEMLGYLSRRLKEAPESFDLRLTLTGPRTNMLSVAQPQTLIVLEKR